MPPENQKRPARRSQKGIRMYSQTNTPVSICQFDTQAMVNVGQSHEPSMATVEIAELTNKRHDHVMRDTKVMLTELYGKSING